MTPTTQRLIRLHCAWLRRGAKTAATIKHRRGAIARLASQINCELPDATPTDLDDWQETLASAVSLSAVATYTSHVRAFYQWMEEAGHVEVSPARNLPVPSVRRHARPIPEHDLAVAISVAPEPVKTWLVLGSTMGLRAMEVILNRDDVAEDIQGRLHIQGIGKGGKLFRLPVPLEAEPYLRPHLHRSSGPLWTDRHGRPVTAYYVTVEVGDFFRSLGMPWTMHNLRHRLGTRLYQETKDLALVQDVLRHGSPQTTRLYVDSCSDTAGAVMDRMSVDLVARVQDLRQRAAAAS